MTWLYHNSVYVHRGPALAGNVLEAGSAKGSKTVPVSPWPIADTHTWYAGREAGMGAILWCRICTTCCQEPSGPACSGTFSLISGCFCPQRVCCRLLSHFIWLLEPENSWQLLEATRGSRPFICLQSQQHHIPLTLLLLLCVSNRAQKRFLPLCTHVRLGLPG